MKRFITKQKKITELVPGDPVFIGEQKQKNVKIWLICYDNYKFYETELYNVIDVLEYIEEYKNIWINIEGLHDVGIIKKVGKLFNIHTLILEDIVHTEQRPKVDVEEDSIFTIVKMLLLDKEKNQLTAEQVSMYLIKNVLITFQEKHGNIFESVRERLRNKKGRVRNSNLTYLNYCLLDTIVDRYMFLMEIFGNDVEELEDKILLQPSNNTLEEININKIELNYFRKIIRPTKEAISKFKGFKTNLITKKEQPFFNDLHDLIHRCHDLVENYDRMLSQQLTVYSININNRLNNIMKVLTVFSVIFIPITFIAGVYGTNFEYIPELKNPNGYFIMWGTMIFVVLSMVAFFKYKKWF